MSFRDWLESEFSPMTLRAAALYVLAIAAATVLLGWGLVELVVWMATR